MSCSESISLMTDILQLNSEDYVAEEAATLENEIAIVKPVISLTESDVHLGGQIQFLFGLYVCHSFLRFGGLNDTDLEYESRLSLRLRALSQRVY